MKKIKETADKKCPECGKTRNQILKGRNSSGTQRCYCKDCGRTYTLEAKRSAYDEETRKQALKIYYSGVSGRKVGKLLGMSKANVYNWIKAEASKKRAAEK
jgi:transposase-like protein